MLTHRGYVMHIRGYVMHIWCINSVFQIQFDFFFFLPIYTQLYSEKKFNILPENSVNSAFHFDLSHQKPSLCARRQITGSN